MNPKTNQAVAIQRAGLEDVALLSRLGARSFEATYASQNTPQDMSLYLETYFSIASLEKQLAEPGTSFLIARLAEEPVGYTKLRTHKLPDCVTGPDPIELERIYAELAYKGKGIGSALMEATLAEAARQGRQTLWLGVWERNLSAIAFYKKWAFQVVGNQDFILGEDVQNDYILSRDLEIHIAQ